MATSGTHTYTPCNFEHICNNLRVEAEQDTHAEEKTFVASIDVKGHLTILEPDRSINWSSKLLPLLGDPSNLGTLGSGTLFYRVEDSSGYRRVESREIGEVGQSFDDWLLDRLGLVNVLGTVARAYALYIALQAIDPREFYEEEIRYEGPSYWLAEIGEADPVEA